MTNDDRDKAGQCGCCGSGRGVDGDAFKGEATYFGEKANFWALHDKITDKYDSDLMGRLNTGLDNLLIFVSPKRPWLDHADCWYAGRSILRR